MNPNIWWNFQICISVPLKWKILKHFTRPKQWAAFRKLFNPPPDKSFLRIYTRIYRHLPSQCFENAVLGCLETVQCKFFFDTNPKHVCWKICKVSGFSAVLRNYTFYNVEWVEVRTTSYWKMSDSFCQFLLALRLSARKSKINR